MFGYYVQEKYSHELKKFNNNFKKYGFYYLILVRAIPGTTPFLSLILLLALRISIQKHLFYQQLLVHYQRYSFAATWVVNLHRLL